MSEISPLRPSPRLISCAGAFPARTYRQPAREPAWLVSDPACFSRWPGSFASYDQESSSWRTCQRSLLGGWIPYSGRWPLSGMLRGGEVCEHQRWVHHTAGRGGSVSLGWPTPTAQAAKHGAPTEWEKQSGRNGLWIAAAQAWPTPAAQTFDQSPEVFDARRARLKLTAQNGNGAGRLLAVEVRRAWPTPAASDNRNRGGPSMPCIQRRIEKGRQVMLTMSVDGRLNPAWVEMLQGFPQGWSLTDGPPLLDHSTHGSHREPDQDSPTTETD